MQKSFKINIKTIKLLKSKRQNILLLNKLQKQKFWLNIFIIIVIIAFCI